MGNEGTRVEITADLHILLQNKLDQLRSEGAKGITFKKLVEKLCTAGLAYQENTNTQGAEEHQTDGLGIHYPINTTPNNYIIESQSKLNSMLEAIRIKEDRLIEKERELDLRDKRINDKLIEALYIKEANLDLQKKLIRSKSPSDKLKNIRIEELEKTVKEFKEENRSLKQEKRETLHEMSRKLDIIERNTKHDTIKDTILPLATPAFVLFSLFQNNKKENGDPYAQFMKGFDRVAPFLSEEQQKEFKEWLENIQQAHSNDKAKEQGTQGTQK